MISRDPIHFELEGHTSGLRTDIPIYTMGHDAGDGAKIIGDSDIVSVSSLTVSLKPTGSVGTLKVYFSPDTSTQKVGEGIIFLTHFVNAQDPLTFNYAFDPPISGPPGSKLVIDNLIGGRTDVVGTGYISNA